MLAVIVKILVSLMSGSAGSFHRLVAFRADKQSAIQNIGVFKFGRAVMFRCRVYGQEVLDFGEGVFINKRVPDSRDMAVSVILRELCLILSF
ncbi:MAG TPA: hypothetical protein DCL35_07020 [Candidatus Omnitrophica bacterium]|nr:hypothetical protein [Candidatus Omnitrophota bacterium]